MTGQPMPSQDDRQREQWCATRRALNQRRHQLAAAAGRLYPGVPRVGGTALLCRDEWIPARPIGLDEIRLRWTEPATPPVVNGTIPASAHLRPPAPDGQRYATYADAVAALDPPALFENRPLYRLLAASLTGPAGAAHLDLTSGRYFDTVSITEALAHELAAALPGDDAGIGMDQLPFRAAVGDPCDLARRPVSVAISTLTLRRAPDGAASFLLHWRDPAKVTHAGGMYQVIPVGIFQPADGTPESERADLSLWRAMVREFSEELLGASEDYGTGDGPFAYENWDFYRRLTSARETGQVRVWCLGLGVDPLSLVTDILTVAVFESGLFDAAFPSVVAENAEGRVVTGQGRTGFSFTGETVSRFTGGAEPMQAAGTAVLRLAWNHRTILLG